MESRTEPAEAEPEPAAAIRRPSARSTAARPPLGRELLLVVGLFVVYKVGRQLADGHTAEAFRNANRVWDWERTLHLPGEGSVQGALLHSDIVVHLANTYYATVHFPATVAFLVWMYLRRPVHYVWSRRVLAAVTAAALALHLTFPLAPPRLLAAAGLVDTGQVYGPTVYGAHPATDEMANQFAAMPSLHFGWALMVAIGLIAATRSRLRWLWLLHPLLTLLVIVGTANHYWLDAVVATALLGIALAVIRLPRGAGATEAHGLVADEASDEADGAAGNSGGAGGAGEKESVPELVGARR
ncbi:phosphatase PAP2 family protein [Streptomyces sp. AK02-04a]|uniref:phosphatase PAP2 family protein n=1 Tax=Streptomyces sp. AK02-04a TaxID=3028649 RepID=UPI0029BBB8C7|nr:phosphatase PAP2 family protein [Streptomyces sp. AK02-04a]MDX3757934.1 phosphatase PAP2 family protein [Streptomyces sp. AK02-04a]